MTAAMIEVAIVAGLVISATVAFLLLKRSPSRVGWTAGPTIDGKNYSSPINVDASGSFDFPQAAPGVHYVTKPCGPITGSGITMRYRIDGDATFHDAQDGNPITVGPMLYFQRSGDDWSGAGQFETYRWWAEGSAGSLEPGEHTITAKFTDRWSAVMSSNSIDQATAFAEALANAGRIGFTLPNDTGAGHGVYASGSAKLLLLDFSII